MPEAEKDYFFLILILRQMSNGFSIINKAVNL